MRTGLLAVLLSTGVVLSLAGCSTLDSINPFSSKGPKMAELQAIQTTAEVRSIWRESVGKGEGYAFSPAVVGSTVYVASKDGTLMRIDDGKQTWKINVGQKLSGGVGADAGASASPKLHAVHHHGVRHGEYVGADFGVDAASCAEAEAVWNICAVEGRAAGRIVRENE